MPSSRWLSFLSVWLLIGEAASADAASSSSEKLLQDIDAALTEDEARNLLLPSMDDLKSLDPQVLEKLVLRQWWTLAREFISRSHDQKVDLSFAVRKAVRTLKDEADELLRTLNPKYGLAQQVSPAFQWAQNDTSIFLTIKYTVRWNAPGALEVTEPSVNMTGNIFNFSGLGKHSNNKYRYFLGLTLFDNIDAQLSIWSAASVGKLSVTLRKRWTRKWPRLLVDKKAKIGNMHVWMEMQEKLDGTLSGLSSVSNSPVTCALTEKLYCVGSDSCKKPANCTQCLGKAHPDHEAGVCAGQPTEKATLSFQDADMDEHQLGGDIKIQKAKNDFDVDTYAVYWGKDDSQKLEPTDGTSVFIGEVPANLIELEVKLPSNSKIPDGATHLLVFSKNKYGEYSSPGSVLLKDAVLPKAKPGGVEFDDQEGEKNHVKGMVTITKAENEDKLNDYSLHWGKSPTRRTSSSFIADVRKEDGKEIKHWLSKTKIPDGATHILVFSKNEFGEHPSPVSVKVVDKVAPCSENGAADCPEGVLVSPDQDPDANQVEVTVNIKKAQDESGIHTYRLHWGNHDCTNSSEKLSFIQDVKVGESTEVRLAADTSAPSGASHILVFSSHDQLGESAFCRAAPFQDTATSGDKKEL